MPLQAQSSIAMVNSLNSRFGLLALLETESSLCFSRQHQNGNILIDVMRLFDNFFDKRLLATVVIARKDRLLRLNTTSSHIYQIGQHRSAQTTTVVQYAAMCWRILLTFTKGRLLRLTTTLDFELGSYFFKQVKNRPSVLCEQRDPHIFYLCLFGIMTERLEPDYRLYRRCFVSIALFITKDAAVVCA